MYIKLEQTDVIKEGDLHSLTEDGEKNPMLHTETIGSTPTDFNRFFWRKQKSMQEILDETVAYYSEDTVNRRSASLGRCFYYHSVKDTSCAVGRCAIRPNKLESINGGMTVSMLRDLDVYLKPEYRGHAIWFWSELQLLHDSKSNWDTDGLSELGKKHVERIVLYIDDENSKSYLKGNSGYA